VPLLRLRGKGSQRLPEVLERAIFTSWAGIGARGGGTDRAFPAARIARLDRDTVTGKRQYETILHDFREGNYDILVARR